MRLVISICHPDGSPPGTAERMRFYSDEDASENITGGWSKGIEVHIQFGPTHFMVCELLDIIDGDNVAFGGLYRHAILQEIEIRRNAFN